MYLGSYEILLSADDLIVVYSVKHPMAHPILLEDWTSYDNRKISEENDKSKFSCSAHWEVEYLADKLRKYYPLKTRQGIMQSITHCCSKISAPHQRERFIECVIRRFVSE